MDGIESPYQILNVHPSESLESIRKRYYKLCMQNHPDLNPSPEAKIAMAKINNAYDTIVANHQVQTREQHHYTTRHHRNDDDDSSSSSSSSNDSGVGDQWTHMYRNTGQESYHAHHFDTTTTTEHEFDMPDGRRVRVKRVVHAPNGRVELKFEYMNSANGESVDTAAAAAPMTQAEKRKWQRLMYLGFLVWAAIYLGTGLVSVIRRVLRKRAARQEQESRIERKE